MAAEGVLMPDPLRTKFTFGFLSLKLAAKGVVAFILAFGVAGVLFALAWRIATGDFGTVRSAFAKGISHLSGIATRYSSVTLVE